MRPKLRLERSLCCRQPPKSPLLFPSIFAAAALSATNVGATQDELADRYRNAVADCSYKTFEQTSKPNWTYRYADTNAAASGGFESIHAFWKALSLNDQVYDQIFEQPPKLDNGSARISVAIADSSNYPAVPFSLMTCVPYAQRVCKGDGGRRFCQAKSQPSYTRLGRKEDSSPLSVCEAYLDKAAFTTCAIRIAGQTLDLLDDAARRSANKDDRREIERAKSRIAEAVGSQAKQFVRIAKVGDDDWKDDDRVMEPNSTREFREMSLVGTKSLEALAKDPLYASRLLIDANDKPSQKQINSVLDDFEKK